MGPISGLASTYLLNAAWQALLAAGAAGLCAWLLRHSRARYLHAVWAFALVAAAVFPLSSLRPDWLLAASVGTVIEDTRAAAPVPMRAAPLPARTNVHTVGSAEWLWPLLASAYLCFIVIRLGRLGTGWVRTRRLLATSQARRDRPQVDALARECAAAIGIEPVPVLWSGELTGPVTIGARRPVILLPESLSEGQSPAVLRSILAHELAHIRRRDFAFNLAYELVFLPVAMHPAAWWIKRRIDASRELACDEMVAERVLDRSSYARSLVKVAGSLAGLPQPAYSLGILDTDILEQRVARLLSPRTGPAGVLVLAAAMAGLAISGWAASSFTFLPAAGDLAGTVFDPSGAAVPRAQVLVRDVRTNEQRLSLTSESGSFRFQGLPAGRYRLEVRQRWFRLYRTAEFVLNSGPAPRVNAVLRLGMVQETLTVHGD